MKVILLKDVAGIGKKSDVRTVAEGYGRNFLIPHGLAAYATTEGIQNVENIAARKGAQKKIQDELLAKNITSLNGTMLIMEEKTNEKGHLFKGIHIEDIRAAIQKRAHIEIPEEAIKLEQPIKEAGEWIIPIEVGNTRAKLKIAVQPSI